MKRLILNRFKLCRPSPAVVKMLAAILFLTGGTARVAFAQHSGGHAGAQGRVGSPPAAHPVAPHPVAPYRAPVTLPGPRSFIVRPYGIGSPAPGFRTGYPFRPIRPRRPIIPIIPIRIFSPFGFGWFGSPFFGFGYGWGIQPGFWPNCGTFLDSGCNALPAYENTLGYDRISPPPLYSEPQFEIQNPPITYYAGENSQFVELFLKDGTVYSVTDYWLVNGELHFKTVTDHGTKVVEQTIDFSQLDLQRTIDVNTERGFRVVLRNEPLEQYLIDHPPSTTPEQPPQP
ncbi:MAG TPA: hypothetical protein VKT71_10465 [Candidatus Acidoferrales bacterium]|nr:hypothetical protein [Candidatus Acidoferrales bacterium]